MLVHLINGISLGSIYAIIALGYTMVYGIAKMLNFAHGDVIMVGGYVAFLSDVIVDPDYQGQGIGRTLVEAVIKRIKDDIKPGYKVKLNLNSAKGKEPFYEKFGFKIRPNEDAGAGMDQWLTLEN